MGGGHAGLNFDAGGIILGVDVAFDASAIEETWQFGVASVKLGPSWLGTVRARVGIPAGPALVYGTAGVAFGNMELSGTAGSLKVTISNTLTGLAIGGGVEMKISDTILGRVEAMHYEFPDQSVSIGGATLAYDTSFTTVRGGLSILIK